MANPELETVRGIVSEALKGQAVTVYLFGSQARGTSGPHSDVDIALDHMEPLPLGLLPRLREALEEAAILAKVDVVDLAESSQALRESVAREGIRWIA